MTEVPEEETAPDAEALSEELAQEAHPVEEEKSE